MPPPAGCLRLVAVRFAVMGRSLFRCLISLLYQREGCDSRWCCLRRHFVGLDAGCPRRICENDMAGIYSKQKNPLFDALLLSGRTRFGSQRAISRQEGVRPALDAIKQGIPFYYLPDQDYRARDAIFVPFFAASAATITGLSRMTRLTGARVLPCVTRMLPGGAGYELTCH